MRLWNTYYIRSDERDYPGIKDTGIYRSDGSLIKLVPLAFVTNHTRSDSGLCVEGSGVLDDGRVVNYSSSCAYGPTCLTGGRVCYSVLDANRFPWGKGSHSNPLEPLRSLATCPAEIPYGSYVYIPRWNGVQIPRIGDIGGFTHDGCFRADDTGGWICPRNNDPPGVHHIDIFAGSMQMAAALERMIPTRSQFDATTRTTSCRSGISDQADAGSATLLQFGAAALVTAYVVTRPSVQSWFRELWSPR